MRSFTEDCIAYMYHLLIFDGNTNYETPGYELLVIFYFVLSEAQNVKQLDTPKNYLEYFSLRTMNTSRKTIFIL
jgi:hypothetical protein